MLEKIVSDFTMLNFIYFIPKISVNLQKAANQAKYFDAKATAMGYNHRYFDCDRLDLLLLATILKLGRLLKPQRRK